VSTGDPLGLYLRYDSGRRLCSLLLGAIEGAAIRYGERVQVREETCMKRGAAGCAFAIRFLRPASPTRGVPTPSPTSEAASTWQPSAMQRETWEAQRRLADLVYAVLPDAEGITLDELQARLRARYAGLADADRPFLVLEALNHLYHAGWAANTANQPGDTLSNRRSWRLPRVGG